MALSNAEKIKENFENFFGYFRLESTFALSKKQGLMPRESLKIC
jgi:hypothetical protein